MRLSTKTRYGVRLMIELGQNYQSGFIQLNDMAGKQGVSEKYAEQIISSLKAAGLVQSQRGAQGGYRLSRAAKDITMREIVENLEGTLELVDQKSGPGSHNIWKRLSDVIKKNLEAISLEEAVEESRKKSGAIVYEI